MVQYFKLKRKKKIKKSTKNQWSIIKTTIKVLFLKIMVLIYYVVILITEQLGKLGQPPWTHFCEGKFIYGENKLSINTNTHTHTHTYTGNETIVFSYCQKCCRYELYRAFIISQNWLSYLLTMRRIRSDIRSSFFSHCVTRLTTWWKVVLSPSSFTFEIKKRVF